WGLYDIIGTCKNLVADAESQQDLLHPV
uniref:Polyprotein n=1 Tax=Globodera pallida TaxID=36090 RepID=A0A183CJK1_GLOPA